MMTSISDAHEVFSINKINQNEFENQLSPYRLVEEKGIAYMIMTTHQALAPIDDKMPATQSEKIYTYIQKNFPNALIIAELNINERYEGP